MKKIISTCFVFLFLLANVSAAITIDIDIKDKLIVKLNENVIKLSEDKKKSETVQPQGFTKENMVTENNKSLNS